MARKIYFYLIIIIFITSIFTASIYAEDYGGQVKIRLLKRPLNLNPIYIFDESSIKITSNIFETLITLNEKGELEPLLADKWEFKDESKKLIINLKKEIYFQKEIMLGTKTKNGGREVTAEDWKWSFNYLASPKNKSPYAHLMERVVGYEDYRKGITDELRGIKVLGKFKLEINFTDSSASFIYNLVNPAAAVMPKEDVDNENLNWDLNPVGTGAFSIAEYKKNFIKLKKNNRYWQKDGSENLPYLDNVYFYFSDLTLSRDYSPLDYSIYKINSDEYSRYLNKENIPDNYFLVKIPKSELYYYAFIFNKGSGNMNSKNTEELRKLLNLIIDRRALIEKLALSSFKSAEDILYKSAYIFKAEKEQKIRKSFEQLTDNKTLKLTLAVNSDNLNISIAEEIKKQLAEFDINLEIKKFSWLKYIEKINSSKDEFDMIMINYDYNNIIKFLRDNYYSSRISSENNHNYYSERLNYLLDYYEIETSASKRNRALQIIKDITAEDLPALYLFQGAETYLIKNTVKSTKNPVNYIGEGMLKYIYLNN